MRPPLNPIEDYCACPSGNHVRRYLPVPETDEEELLITTYDAAYGLACQEDLAEAIERFMADGPTAANLEWAAQTHDRILDRLWD